MVEKFRHEPAGAIKQVDVAVVVATWETWMKITVQEKAVKLRLIRVNHLG